VYAPNRPRSAHSPTNPPQIRRSNLYPTDPYFTTHRSVFRPPATINRSFDTIGIVNILFPPLFLVDFATGAMFKYDPDQYSVTMTPAGSHR
jgi:hypothetical protein